MSNPFDILDNITCEDDVSLDASYPEPTGPRPLVPGKYAFTVEKFGWKTKKDGTPILYQDEQGNNYPILQIVSVKIVEGLDSEREVYLYQDISTKPFRRGAQMVSRASDMLHSIDPSLQVSGTKALLHELVNLMQSGCVIRASFDWSAYDNIYPDAKFEEAGGKDRLTKDEVNKVYKDTRVRGFKNIAKDNAKRGGNNKLTHVWIGPSLNTFEARPEIMSFISTKENVQMGPDKAFVA